MGKAAAPAFRSDLALQRREERQGVGVRNRQHWNFRDRLGVFNGETFRARNRADARSERIAGIVGVHDAAALDAVFRPPAAGWIIVAVEKAVLSRVGVDDAADRAVLGCNLGLDAAPAGRRSAR